MFIDVYSLRPKGARTHTQTRTHTCNRLIQDLQLKYMCIHTQKRFECIYIYMCAPTLKHTHILAIGGPRTCNLYTCIYMHKNIQI